MRAETSRHAERDLPALGQPKHIARPLAPARRQRRHADPLPDEGQQRQRHDEKESAAPADMIAEKAGERRGDGVAGIDHREPPWHSLFRHQVHDDGRRHRPEAADGHAEQGAADPSAPHR